MTGEESLDLFDTNELSTLNWLELLNHQPDFIELCDTNKFKKGDNLIFAAFGGGFTWGAIYLKWALDPK